MQHAGALLGLRRIKAAEVIMGKEVALHLLHAHGPSLVQQAMRAGDDERAAAARRHAIQTGEELYARRSASGEPRDVAVPAVRPRPRLGIRQCEKHLRLLEDRAVEGTPVEELIDRRAE